MLRLYDYSVSGNCYKIRLLLNQLELEFDRIEVNLLKGDARTEEFSAKNPLQKVPVLEWPDGRRLTESNAILFYLADGTKYLPDDPWKRAQVLRWQCFEQFSHTPYIGAVRWWHLSGVVEQNRALLEEKIDRGYRALRVMDGQLSKTDYLIGSEYTIADISLYSYTHVADEGGFDLEPYSAVGAWLKRVSTQPRHIEITE